MVEQEFAFGAEIECLTSVPDNPGTLDGAICRFLEVYSELAPSLPATQGIFTGYAKVYCDVGHVELALAECDDPYLLASLFERVQVLAARAVGKLAEDGVRLVLANNNHSELLRSGCPVWGDHESFMVEKHPDTFAAQILPFLVTRLYQGAGGIHFPTGNFLAAVRPICMELATGGGTTEMRAIHSTAREEHHMGAQPKRFRYHLILGDGHRSHFNLALQFGATALAIKAILFDPELHVEIERLRGDFPDDWIKALKTLNVLAKPGQQLRVDPLVLKTQRLYLEAAKRYAASLAETLPWVSRILRDWEDTLSAYAVMDRAWLAARLDAFTKYEFYSAVLGESGSSWEKLPGNEQQFCELALLDHSYHEFCNPQSVFNRLDSAGLLQHRVGHEVLPGEERNPFVPETQTRARARASFIRENQDRKDLVVDWSWIHDRTRNLYCLLEDPFSQEFGGWQDSHPSPGHRRYRASLAPYLQAVLAAYDAGEYEVADAQLMQLERRLILVGDEPPVDAVRYRAWLQARRGYCDGPDFLRRIYPHGPSSLLEITDYCCVYRFRGLGPDLAPLEPLIQREYERACELPPNSARFSLGVVFREHAANAVLRCGRLDRALAMLEGLLTPDCLAHAGPRSKGRILATAGEAFRRAGERKRAGCLLKEAAELQLQHRYFGYLGDFTYASLAKWECSRRRALGWLAKALEIQHRNRHWLGHTGSLLLESRLGRDVQRAAENQRSILARRGELPALAECPLLARILQSWSAWTKGDKLNAEEDEFWGL